MTTKFNHTLCVTLCDKIISDSCSFQVTGVVKAVHVKEGDTVDEDQILVEIEQSFDFVKMHYIERTGKEDFESILEENRKAEIV